MNHTQILTAVLAATIATGAPVMAVAAYAQTPPTVAGTEKSQTATGEAAVLAGNAGVDRLPCGAQDREPSAVDLDLVRARQERAGQG